MTEFKTVGSSMLPNLSSGQIAIGRLRPPARGDVVFFHNKATKAVSCKRVVALRGDVVTIRGNRLWLDGQPAEEAPYAVLYGSGRETLSDAKPVKVPRFHIYVLSDNRPSSADSRAFGCVPMKNLIAVMDSPAGHLQVVLA